VQRQKNILCQNRPFTENIMVRILGNMGHKQFFSAEDEMHIANGLLLAAEWGFPFTHMQHIIKRFFDRKGVRIKNFNNNLPCRMWNMSDDPGQQTVIVRKGAFRKNY
jgi:hypothetical protein